MIELSIVVGLVVAGVAATLLFLLYRGLGRGRSSHLAGPSLQSRFDRPGLFGEPASGEWFPSQIPAEPEGDIYYTDEERVLRLLITNQGRMQQSELVRETGWSSAKVSRLLHRMEERNDISRVSAGRTKVVYLGQYRIEEQTAASKTNS